MKVSNKNKRECLTCFWKRETKQEDRQPAMDARLVKHDQTETKRTVRNRRANGARRNGKPNESSGYAVKKRVTKRTGRKRWANDARRNEKRNRQNANIRRRVHNAAGKLTV